MSTSFCTLREQLGVKKGVPAETHINAAAGTILRDPSIKLKTDGAVARAHFAEMTGSVEF